MPCYFLWSHLFIRSHVLRQFHTFETNFALFCGPNKQSLCCKWLETCFKWSMTVMLCHTFSQHCCWRFRSSGMWRCVIQWVVPYILEDCVVVVIIIIVKQPRRICFHGLTLERKALWLQHQEPLTQPRSATFQKTWISDAPYTYADNCSDRLHRVS